MKRFIAASAVMAATFPSALADLCSKGSQDIEGNWYCQEVTGITYTGVGTAGSYQRVIGMNSDASSATAGCTMESQSYSGSVAPLGNEVGL